MNKTELTAIFEDTKNIVDNNTDLQNSKTYKSTIEQIVNPIGRHTANIETINSDTVSTGLEFSKKGKTAILNMASYKRPGGGVAKGAKAQEECLFRCSNLYKVISDTLYPLNINEGLYTNDAIFLKDKYYNGIEPFKVDVITVAAINLTKENPTEVLENYNVIMKDKIRLMFDLAYKNGCKNIVLGAWGCGVFNNDPATVAAMFEDVITYKPYGGYSYYECFENIIFAVINDHNSVGDNYDVFKKVF